ncbi:MAG: hypothetical protein E6H45_10130, partial [Betaproteobacteria bacterium]
GCAGDHPGPGGPAAPGRSGIAARRSPGLGQGDQAPRDPVPGPECKGRRQFDRARGPFDHRGGARARGVVCAALLEGRCVSLSAAALDAAMQPLVESAVGLLTSAKLERLRRCGNSTCYWLFIDETKNHSRRWCEMASCGNVVKVRRHREKARSAAH